MSALISFTSRSSLRSTSTYLFPAQQPRTKYPTWFQGARDSGTLRRAFCGVRGEGGGKEGGMMGEPQRSVQRASCQARPPRSSSGSLGRRRRPFPGPHCILYVPIPNRRRKYTHGHHVDACPRESPDERRRETHGPGMVLIYLFGSALRFLLGGGVPFFGGGLLTRAGVGSVVCWDDRRAATLGMKADCTRGVHTTYAYIHLLLRTILVLEEEYY